MQELDSLFALYDRPRCDRWASKPAILTKVRVKYVTSTDSQVRQRVVLWILNELEAGKLKDRARRYAAQFLVDRAHELSRKKKARLRAYLRTHKKVRRALKRRVLRQ